MTLRPILFLVILICQVAGNIAINAASLPPGELPGVRHPQIMNRQAPPAPSPIGWERAGVRVLVHGVVIGDWQDLRTGMSALRGETPQNQLSRIEPMNPSALPAPSPIGWERAGVRASPNNGELWKSVYENGPFGIYQHISTCNAYLLKDGDAGLMINLGDGTGLASFAETGVKEVEWILFTDHHREQTQGGLALQGLNIKVAVPAGEKNFFEQPQNFRKLKPRLGDPFTVHATSYLRPPADPIKADRTFSRMDTFQWRGNEIWCVETKGHSPGGMTYLIKKSGDWFAFSGDLIRDGARMHTYFDTEWDYSFGSGIYALHNSAALVESFKLKLLFPSHGPVIKNPAGQLAAYQKKLRKLESHVLRGYSVDKFAPADQDRVSKPTSVPYFWQVTPHIYKFKGPNFYPNFVMILADSGHALLVDCGLFEKKFLDDSIQLMKERLGLKQIDAMLISHMHGDHFLEGPHLQQNHGAQIWALDRMADQVERPERYDYVAPIQSYNHGFDAIKVDRILKSGETFAWEGFKLTADWMPGQTEFAMGLHGTIDGKKVVFTGDNIFADSSNPKHTGHEAIVARNSGILEEGYIYGAEFLTRLKPDLILGGHSFVMDKPAGLIKRYRQWAYDIRETFRSLSPDNDYRYWFDPYWVRAEPYRVNFSSNHPGETKIHIRNFRNRQQRHLIKIHTPPGVIAEPELLQGSIEPGKTKAYPVKFTATPEAIPGVQIAAFDITLDGVRYGEWFDVILNVE